MLKMSGDKKRHFTVLIVPHSEKSSQSFKLPVVFVKIFSVMFAISVVLLMVFAYNYHNLVQDNKKLEVLREENTEQEVKIDDFAKKTKKLEEELKTLMETENKIRELADLDDIEDDIDEQEEFNEVNLDRDNDELVRTGHTRGSEYNSETNGTVERTEETIRLLSAQIPQQKENLENTKLSLAERQEELKHTPDYWPVEGRISSSFGYRNSPITGARQFHDGIDIAAPHRTPVKAAANGRVQYASYRSGYGNLIVINHGYGYETHYAHLASFDVDRGEEVEKGEVIGFVGNTGNSTGPHLHFEIHVNNSPVDPKEYLK
ncbi:Murein DD-endopeptidase MepM [Natranaerofaba carboxydovora]|nr:Murein DD-endopeptidase MepM [Natranaerofaba carboxydovora]